MSEKEYEAIERFSIKTVDGNIDDVTAIKSIEEKCGRCTWCVKDDGSPYCLHKDLYTTVEPDRDCDETDHYGRLWFIEEK